MRGVGKEAEIIAAKRRDMVEIAYRMFCEKGIDKVSMQEIADNSNYGIATIYRYFKNKLSLVVETAACKWEDYLKENRERRPEEGFEGMTAAEVFDFYLDSFIELYRDHKELLRFNQYFNVYIYAGNVDKEALKPYEEIIRSLKGLFHGIYEKGVLDRTIKCDVPEDEMFSVTLHLMLAAVTRYAVGLAYIPPGFDPEAELYKQKEAIRYLYIP